MDAICYCHGLPIVFRTHPGGQKYIVHIKNDVALPSTQADETDPTPIPPLAEQ
jgi:hypothetical protein